MVARINGYPQWARDMTASINGYPLWDRQGEAAAMLANYCDTLRCPVCGRAAPDYPPRKKRSYTKSKAWADAIARRTGKMPRGWIDNDTSHLIRPTAASWTHEREQEARMKGYEVSYSFEDGFVTASYFNGPIFCYSREWMP